MMKKITLLLAIFTVAFGYSQKMPLDFDDAKDVFAGFNGAVGTVIDDSGDKVLQLAGAANAWDGATVQFENLVDLSDDANNTITFMVNVPAGSSNDHLLKFEENVGGNGPAENQVDFTTTGTGWQSVSVDFGAGLGQYGKMSVFMDKGDANAGIALTYLFDDFAGAKSVDRPAGATAPTTAAPTPATRNAWDVISLYSDAYTQTGVTNFDAGWCGNGSTEEIDIAGNKALAWKGNACQGILLTAIDASAFTHMHVDVYIADGTDMTGKVFNLKFVDTADNNVLEVNFNDGSSPALEAGKWVSIDVAVNLADFDKWNEFGVTSGNLNNIAWYDNLYVYRAATANVDTQNLLNVSLSPSPAKNQLKISAENTIEKAAIYNVLGKQVKAVTINKKSDFIDVSTLSTGIYILKYTVNNTVGSMKFIKE